MGDFRLQQPFDFVTERPCAGGIHSSEKMKHHAAVFIFRYFVSKGFSA
jgi:hypothetical protein